MTQQIVPMPGGPGTQKPSKYTGPFAGLDSINNKLYIWNPAQCVWVEHDLCCTNVNDLHLGDPVETDPNDGNGIICWEFPVLDIDGNPTGDVRKITLAEPQTAGVYYSGTPSILNGVVTFPQVNDAGEGAATPQTLDLSSLISAPPADIIGGGDIAVTQDANGDWVVSYVDDDAALIDGDGPGGITITQNANGDYVFSVATATAQNGVENTGTATNPVFELDIDSLPAGNCPERGDQYAADRGGTDVRLPVDALITQIFDLQEVERVSITGSGNSDNDGLQEIPNTIDVSGVFTANSVPACHNTALIRITTAAFISYDQNSQGDLNSEVTSDVFVTAPVNLGRISRSEVKAYDDANNQRQGEIDPDYFPVPLTPNKTFDVNWVRQRILRDAGIESYQVRYFVEVIGSKFTYF